MKAFLDLGIGILAAVLIVRSAITGVPPVALPRARMTAIQRAVREYFDANRSLPGVLDELGTSEIDVKLFRLDAWERPIGFRAVGTTVTLTSFGPDGVQGESEDDVALVFDAAK